MSFPLQPERAVLSIALLLPPLALAAEPSDVGIHAYHALLVGVEDYDGAFPSLSAPEKDVAAVATVLRDRYGFTDLRILTDDDDGSVVRAIQDGASPGVSVSGGLATRDGILDELTPDPSRRTSPRPWPWPRVRAGRC